MFRNRASLAIVAIVAFVVGGMVQPFQPSEGVAQGSCRTFPETGKQVCGRFLEYWNTHGGLAQQGLPLSGEFTEISGLNGKSYTVQYFERAVFEKHPENPAPYDVLLSQLGTFQFKGKYPGGDPALGPAPTAVPPPPPPDIQNQVVTFSGFLGKGTLRGTVTGVKEAATIPPVRSWSGGTARGKYVVVTMSVVNTGTTSVEIGEDELKLRDVAGRTFDMVDDIDVWLPASELYGTTSYHEDIQPGLPTLFTFIFDVPRDIGTYYLVGK